MFYILLFLASLLSCFASAPSLAITENDPSSLLDGVSVITGDLYTFEEDYIVEGAEPIRIHRSFLSRDGYFKDYQHLTASFLCASNRFLVNEPNGTSLLYSPDPQNNVFPIIGEHFYSEKKKKPLIYRALFSENAGAANTKNGEISAKSNLKNQYLVFDPKRDEYGKSFTLYAADGTIRRYDHHLSQEKVDGGPYGKHYVQYFYRLVSETLPNGRIVHYHWDKKNRINRIHTSNPSGTKTFASIDIPVFNPKDPPATHTISGSDQRALTYNSHPTEIKHFNVLNELISPELPSQRYGWQIRKKWGAGQEIKVPHLVQYSMPNGRTLIIDYDNEHRVKTLSAPVGKDRAIVPTHTFFYNPNQKSSFVLDAQNNKTAYFWNDEYRLTRIERYKGESELHSSDRFSWDKNLLKCKALLDEKGSPVSARTYTYDARGNVKEETIYGNLSGSGPPLTLDAHNLPIENGVEKYIKKRTYSEDGKNLLLKEEGPNGRSTIYSYWGSTHMPHTRTIFKDDQPQILYTFIYNEDMTLVSETVEDAASKTTQYITPVAAGPFVGLPEIIQEKDKNGALLKKTVLHYKSGARVWQKDIYDANGNFRYSLYMTYDGKGRLKSETNAIGQKAKYGYDEAGNLSYRQDFSGKLETFYHYDFANRLIKKEEKGTDGVHRIYKYDYDTKNHLVLNEDPFGNQTTYVPDPFGNQKEIRPPPVPDEHGKPIAAIIKQTFDSRGNLTEKIDAENYLTTTSYNAYNKPIRITHPDGATETFTYYLDGQLKSRTDSCGVITSYTYDYLGRVLTKTISDAVETYEYEGRFLKKKTDPEKNVAHFEYDSAGRKKKETFEDESTTYEYDELGRLYKTVKGDLVSITKYDLLDRVIEERNETLEGRILRQVSYGYDAAGNRDRIIRNIEGHEAIETLRYDSAQRLIEKKDALGFIETHTYDPKINKQTHTDPMGLLTVETYNQRNQLSSLEKQKNGKTLFLEEKFYDKNGQPSLQVDTIFNPDGTSRIVNTRWEYNSRSKLKTLTEAADTLDAKITHYTYTPRLELETLTNPNGVILTHTYNDYGQLTSLVSSDGTVSHTMTYNLLGHLQTSDGITRETDPHGRILNERFPAGYSIENRYDTQGRRITCTLREADCLIAYTYDSPHIKSVSRHKLDSTLLYTHTYLQHDLSGNVTQEQTLDGQNIQNSFDALNRKQKITAPAFTQEVLIFDGAGNILQMERDGRKNTYTYDDLYQLTSETGAFNHTYSCDSLNNRLKKDQQQHQINDLNQCTDEFSYNKNGNPISRRGTTYTYDALDRLIKIESPSYTQTYTYDYLNRRLSTCAQGQTIYYLYDGQNEIGSLDASHVPLDLRILGNAPYAEIGAAIAIELKGSVYTPLHDLQGNLAVLGATQYSYSAFGEEHIEGSTLSPWTFSSKRKDPDTGLINFGRRYYLPSLGRWLTPDPAGFSDGMNLYAYVHNNPLNHFDEFGLIMMARDYRTLQQVNSLPWEGRGPIDYVSHFGRHLAAKAAHELYDTFATPLLRDGYRAVNQVIPSASYNIESRIVREKNCISDFFAVARASPSFSSQCSFPRMTDCYIPFGPGKPGGIATQTKASPAALNPARKISAPHREYLDPHAIRFTQPTVSQNFSNGGEINDMIQNLRSGKLTPEDIPIIRVVEFEGKMYTLDNRRLAAFQNAGIKKIPTEKLSLDDPKLFREFTGKYNPVDDGFRTVVIENASKRELYQKTLREHGKIK